MKTIQLRPHQTSALRELIQSEAEIEAYIAGYRAAVAHQQVRALRYCMALPEPKEESNGNRPESISTIHNSAD